MQSEYITIHYKGQDLKLSVKKRIDSQHLLLFLHGLGCTKESFDAAFDEADLNKHSICILDFLGFGSSDKPDKFSYALEDQAAVVKKVIDQLAPKTISVVAHSMGGAIGLLLARQLPNLAQFINIEGNLVSEDCGLASRNTAKQRLDTFEAHGFQDFLRMLTSSERQDFHQWAEWYKTASPKALHASARSMIKWSDSGKLLDTFNSLESTTYIYGDEELKNYLLPHLETATVRYIPGLKHFMMMEDPKTFFAIISEAFS